MTNRDRAAQWIQLVPVNMADGRFLPALFPGFDVRRDLSTKSFVHFKNVDVIQRQIVLS